jgi:hypothetical protein
MSTAVDNKIATVRNMATALEPDDETITLSSLPGTRTATSYVLPEGLAEDEWRRVGVMLFHINRAVQWWIGDWIRYGERRYGETYTQALEATDYAEQTLMNFAYVAGAVEPSRRRENLSFSHHAEVAALPVEKQDEWLETAEVEQLPVAKLRRELQTTGLKPAPTEITRTITVKVEQDRHAQEVASRRNITIDEAYGQAATEAFEWGHG